jgi:uncharacterized protein YdiU (UPF0061 family)
MIQIPFDNTFCQLGDKFLQANTPQRVPSPKLIRFNEELANELGIEYDLGKPADLANVFSGNELVDGSSPLSQAYAGHQFGHFVPQLGDGRAHLLGEVLSKSGHRYDIQLKGSGTSKFSRQGDGKSPLGPVLREYIVSEAMNALGIPTTRALCAVGTGEAVQREISLPGAVFTRVASSHLRVGTFEYFLRQGDFESLRTVFEYTLQRHFPEIDPSSANSAERFLACLRDKISDLVAQWLSVGFIHGVMNTDNTSLAGITIDYGPCAFMDEFRSNQVFSYIDRQGRYAFHNQPRIALWNLERLAECLIPLMPDHGETAIQKLTEVLAKFESQFVESWLKFHRQKFGFTVSFSEELELYQSWFQIMEQRSFDFTLSFADLRDRLIGQAGNSTVQSHQDVEVFLQRWSAALKQQGIEADQASQTMLESNPSVIPRNHQVEKAIRLAYRGDFEHFHRLCEITSQPYANDDQVAEEFLTPPKDEERIANTFCGT